MGQLDEDICQICVEPVRFYSLYNRQKCYFCSPLCHQEYNARQAVKPNLILVKIQQNEELHDSKSSTPRVNISTTDLAGERFQRVLETYLLSGKDVNAKMGDGDPLLFHVVKKADIEALRQLLDRGVDVNQKGQNDVTSAMVAAVEGCSDKLQMLIDHGANFKDAVDKEGKTVLHKGSRWKKDTECAKMILAGAPHLVSKKDNFQQTPLHEAAGEGNDLLIELLLAEGAEVNVFDNLMRSPLHWAVIQGYKTCAEILLRHKCKAIIDAADRFDHRPIHYSIQSYRDDLAKILIAKNCKLGDTDATGASMLIFAVKHGDKTMCELMLHHCRNINAKDRQGWTALHYAAQRGDKDICEMLLRKELDVNIRDFQHQQTPIYIAVNLCHEEIVSLLLAHEIKLLIFDDLKRSPIHYASLKGAANILQMLLDHVVKAHLDGGQKCMNAKDSSGQSALNMSATMCNKECCKILLSHNAKVDIQSKSRLIEMGLIAPDIKRPKKETLQSLDRAEVLPTAGVVLSKPVRHAHVTTNQQPFFVPSNKPATSPDNEVQLRELLEKKRKMQKAWHTWKESEDDSYISPSVQNVSPKPDSPTSNDQQLGYLQMYKTKQPSNTYLGQELQTLNGVKPVSAKYGKTFSYSMGSNGINSDQFLQLSSLWRH